MHKHIISPIKHVIEDIRLGKMVIMIDDENRENEGDLIIASQFATASTINFMCTYGRGLICLTLTHAMCDNLKLPLMTSNNHSQYGTNFTVSIEAKHGVTTGISAFDRAHTIQTALLGNARELVSPGHIFPLRAVAGGVLQRAGHTEAACDLSALAGLTASGVICEILNTDGSMARLNDLIPYSQQHGLKIGTIADLISYRQAK